MKDQSVIFEAMPDSASEKVRLEGTFNRKKRGFAAFLICCAILVAAFAVTALWQKNGGQDWFEQGGSSEIPDAPDSEKNDLQDSPSTTPPTALPEGAIPILPMDLSYTSYGKSYLNNETDYSPDFEALLSHNVSCTVGGNQPLVLILHTHTSESYLPKGTAHVSGAIGDLTYSENAEQGVLSVGETLAQTLNQNGIFAIHCSVSHDERGLSGSYQRAAETIRSYLERYPSIEYVIDLHRDSVTSQSGAIIRSEGKHGTESVAQVMAVVGSDRNGTEYEGGWEGNLALALQLRESLNANGNTVARPVSLRRSSYNQELAKYSLLLEIGTAANSPEEAKRAAVLVGEALADLIQAR